MPAVGAIFDVGVEVVTESANRLGRAPVRENVAPGAYFVAVSYTAEQFTEFLQTQDEQWKPVIEMAGYAEP